MEVRVGGPAGPATQFVAVHGALPRPSPRVACLYPPKKELTSLPDEVLMKILSYFNYHRGHLSEPRSYLDAKALEQLGSLPLVCRSFYRLATPLLYSTVVIGSDWSEAYKRREALRYRSFSENSWLRTLPRQLSVWASCTLPQNIEATLKWQKTICQNYVAWFRNIRGLNFSSGNNDFPEMVIAALTWKWDLERLSLDMSQWTPEVEEIMSESSTVTMIDLSNLGINWQHQDQMKRSHGRGQFAELAIRSIDFQPAALVNLINWSSKLDIFELHWPMHWHGPYRHVWNLDTVVPSLTSQKENLRVLKLRCPDRSNLGQSFDISMFHRLERLELWLCDTGTDVRHARQFVAPNVTDFVWDLTAWASHGDESFEFSRDMENWVRAFARASVESHSALKRVHLVYPEKGLQQDLEYIFESSSDSPRTTISPDGVARELRDMGIELVYSALMDRVATCQAAKKMVIKEQAEEEREMNEALADAELARILQYKGRLAAWEDQEMAGILADRELAEFYS